MNVYYHTFGCKVNQYDTEAIRQGLEAKDAKMLTSPEGAQVAVINTCTVTKRGDYKTRQLVRRLNRLDPHMRIVVVGCSAEKEKDKLTRLAGVDLVLGNVEKFELPDYISKLNKANGSPEVYCGGVNEQKLQLSLPTLKRFSVQTRAFLKIQDGCDAKCTFCIIPAVRGSSRSRPVTEIIDETNALNQNGHREIVLTGIRIGFYGKDLKPRTNFANLLRAILVNTSIERIRLSSLEVNEVTDDLLELMALNERICRHLHIPMQSGSDRVLSKMKRWYDSEKYVHTVRKATQIMPGIGLGADVIVGFPGEGETEFGQTYRLIESLPFSYLHVFPYSVRPGTAAAEFADQVEIKEIGQRSKKLIKLASDKSIDFRTSLVGKMDRVLVEERSDNGMYVARASNYLKVYLSGQNIKPNDMVDVCYGELFGNGMLGSLSVN